MSLISANVFNFELNTMKRYVFLLAILLNGFGLAAQVSNPDHIVGVWKSPSNKLMIKIDKVGNYFQGRIVWFDSNGMNQPVLDENNPEERLQKIPLKGNKIIKELSFNSSKSAWDGGTFYNHEEGKLYNCHIISHTTGQIKITQYLQNNQDGIVETWTRQ